MIAMIAMTGVTCPRCAARLAECPANGHGFPMAERRYDVGNVSAVEMGHQYYHHRTGRVALCAAGELPRAVSAESR
jgi:hypothetical protein